MTGWLAKSFFLVIPCGYFSQFTFVSLIPRSSYRHVGRSKTDIGGTGQRERDLGVFDPFGLITGEEGYFYKFFPRGYQGMLGWSFPGLFSGGVPGRSRATHLRLALAGMLLTHSRNAISSSNCCGLLLLTCFVPVSVLCCALPRPALRPRLAVFVLWCSLPCKSLAVLFV
jgi:hypothetical protein